MILKNSKLIDKDTYFIGDRIALSQVSYFLITGITIYLVEYLDLTNFFLKKLWWLFLLVLPLPMVIFMLVKKRFLYFNCPWQVSYSLFLMIWGSYTVYLGLLVDNIVGPGNAILVSLFMVIIYLGGYLFARELRMLRHSFFKEQLIYIALIISISIISVSTAFGIWLYLTGLKDIFAPNKYLLFDINQTSRFGIYLIIIGIGIVISCGLHYFMFFCLHDPKGLDVRKDPPSKLFIRVMMVSILISFISWILLLLLFPPLAGAGGGDGDGGGNGDRGGGIAGSDGDGSRKRKKRMRRHL